LFSNNGDFQENEVVKFIACGKNELLDADMNYSLDQ
jgi:hypothetical protein